MKPLMLKMQAFGPFAGAETVDFTRLGPNPLFLINGPTGAGKSSILDAICFALYGATTGAEREPAQMRCDHADADSLTEVNLDFSLGEQVYRVRRLPTQERPKNRGEGTTTQQAEAQLWQLDGSAEGNLLVAKSVTDATSRIRDLIGLDVEQFRQVMVLPQGKFRELLMADSRDREKIFGQLFQTGIYRRIEEQMKTRAAGIRQAVDQHQNQVRGILQSADLGAEEQVGEELALLEPELGTALAARDKARARHLQAVGARDQAVELSSRFDRLASRQAEFAEKIVLAPEFNARQAQLDRALKAQGIRHLYDQHRSAIEVQGKLKRQLQQADEDLQAAITQHRAAETALASAKRAYEAVDHLKQQQLELKQYRDRLQTLANAQKQLQERQAIWNSSRLTVDSNREAQTKLAAEKAAIDRELEAIASELVSLASKQIELAALEQKHQQRQTLEKLFDGRRQLQDRERKLSESVEAEKAAFEQDAKRARETELAWHSGQAALLARELRQNDPCPVCGSLQHPSPACEKADGGPVTHEQVEAARQQEDIARKRLQVAENHRQTCRNDLVTAEKEINQLQLLLGPEATQPLQVLTNMLKASEAGIGRLLARQARQKALGARITDINGQQSELTEALSALEAKAETTRDQFIQARASVEDLEQQIPESYRDRQTLEQALAAVGTRIGQLTDALNVAEKVQVDKRSARDQASTRHEESGRQCADQQQTCSNAESAWQEALAESEFASPEAYRQALLTGAQQQQLKVEIDKYRADLASLEGAVQQLQTDLAEQSPPDMVAIEQRLEEASGQVKLAETTWQQLDQRHNQLLGIRSKLARAHKAHEKLEAEYAIYGTLSDVANGQTGNRISLQRFVLSVLLDDVLIQASHRLYSMSKGRYQLVRKEDRARGNKASGLELEVEDSYTGKTRPVATLSGGESFMAALSLALGLSDVVQAWAGGIRLDTLFIDEGFGSLDPESLDLAVRTLMDLQASGRMIGIISHVTELKEQMALRLDVVSSRNGSSIRTVAA